MKKLAVLDQKGKKAAEVNLPESVFSYDGANHLLYEAVNNFLANKRQGTVSTKTRAEVSGGGRKPWRQKGTGRARVGSTRSPLWKKGGTIFGPRPRDYSYEIPKKARRNALKIAIAKKHAGQELLVLENLELKEPKTREAQALLKEFRIDSALLVDFGNNKNLFTAMRNIPGVKVVSVETLNVYDVLKFKRLIFSQKAFETAMERLK